MMTFGEYIAFQGGVAVLSHQSTKTAASPLLATPGKDDTRRAIEKARRRGTPVTPADLTNAISPESQQTANQGVLSLSATPVPRKKGSTPWTARTLG